MRILYHVPFIDSIYAARTIFNGYKNAFLSLGHEFRTFSKGQNLEDILNEYSPDLFFTGASEFHLAQIDIHLMNSFRKKGLKVLVNIPYWNSPFPLHAINEARGLKDSPRVCSLIANGMLGDIFYNQFEQYDGRMDGFESATKQIYHTIPLAADKIVIYPEFSPNFSSEVSFIGTYHPEKREIFDQWLFPLREKYELALYGQDWNWWDRNLGYAQKLGQYFDIPYLKKIRKPKLNLDDERKIYSSSLVSINLHHVHQHKFGGDCNERAFKIPLAGGFQISDEVACLKHYFVENKEIIMARNRAEWYDKIEFFIRNPDKRVEIIEAGKRRVLSSHTYHHRIEHIFALIIK